jgi:hypothetical protein
MRAVNRGLRVLGGWLLVGLVLLVVGSGLWAEYGGSVSAAVPGVAGPAAPSGALAWSVAVLLLLLVWAVAARVRYSGRRRGGRRGLLSVVLAALAVIGLIWGQGLPWQIRLLPAGGLAVVLLIAPSRRR